MVVVRCSPMVLAGVVLGCNAGPGTVVQSSDAGADAVAASAPDVATQPCLHAVEQGAAATTRFGGAAVAGPRGSGAGGVACGPAVLRGRRSVPRSARRGLRSEGGEVNDDPNDLRARS
jgi:hypothetical protein